MSSLRNTFLWISLGLALSLGGVFMFLGPPLPAAGMNCSVYAEGLEKVAALAVAADGSLYATLERTRGRGELVRIDRTGTHRVLAGLDKPDGLLLNGNRIFITSESGSSGLAVYDGRSTQRFDSVHQAEGIAMSAAGDLLIIEDRKHDGRLLRVDPVSGAARILAAGLSDGEGVCESPDGAIWFVEKVAHHLSRLTDDGVQALADELIKPAFLNCQANGTVLITEDRSNFGRLLRYDSRGLKVLVRNLRAPQAAVVGRDGALYIAEQNRDRVLRCSAN